MNVNSQPQKSRDPNSSQQRGNAQSRQGADGNPLHETGFDMASIIDSRLMPPPRSPNAAMATELRSQLPVISESVRSPAIRMTDQDETHRLYNAPGMNVNAPSAGGFTPLMMSVTLNNLAQTKTLLALPEIDVNSGNRNGNTALHLAVLKGQVMHLKALLDDARIATHILNSHGETALCIAAKYNRAEMVEALLRHQLLTGPVPTHLAGDALNAYKLAADHNAFSVIRRILDVMPELLNATRADGHTALTAAIKANRSDVVHALLKKYPDINVNLAGEEMGTALNVAANLRNFDSLLMLLRHPGLDPNHHLDANGNTVLHEAASRGDANIVQALMSALPAIDINAMTSCNGTPLLCAARSGDVDTIRVLVARTSDINERCKDGWSVLHYAALTGRVEPIRYLLQLPNINPAAMTNTDHYPSDVAAHAGHAELAHILHDEELRSCMPTMWD